MPRFSHPDEYSACRIRIGVRRSEICSHPQVAAPSSPGRRCLPPLVFRPPSLSHLASFTNANRPYDQTQPRASHDCIDLSVSLHLRHRQTAIILCSCHFRVQSCSQACGKPAASASVRHRGRQRRPSTCPRPLVVLGEAIHTKSRGVSTLLRAHPHPFSSLTSHVAWSGALVPPATHKSPFGR